MTEACAVPVSGWTVLRAVKWTVLHAVRWTRVIGTGVVLLVAALFIQPPAQGAPAAPAKADPSLYAQSVAHPSETFPVIVREAAPNTDSAESLVKSLGGRVTHELGIVGGFSALVPGSAVPELSASPLVWRVWGDAPVHMQGVSMGQYDYAAANTVWKQVINLPKTNNQYTGAGVTVALVDTGVVPVPDLASRSTATATGRTWQASSPARGRRPAEPTPASRPARTSCRSRWPVSTVPPTPRW